MTTDFVQTRMTAAEYSLQPETSVPTELINGEIVVSSSPKHRHQKVVGKTYTLLLALTGKGDVVLSPMDVYLDELNVFQSDVFWVSGDDSLCKLGDDDYWYGAPDLICEVLSPGTARKDRDDKFKVYARTGVRELWLIDPLNEYIEVFIGAEGEFTRQGVYQNGDSFQSPLLDNQTVELKQFFVQA